MAADPASPPKSCTQCNQPLNGFLAAHVCPSCGYPQRVTAGEDYFTVLGAPRRFRQDPAALEKRFYEISRALHPDRFAAVGAEARRLSHERMSLVNQAYQALKNPDQLRSYFLRLEGVESQEGTSSAKAQIPMELAESWFELQDSLIEDPVHAAEKLRTFEEELQSLRQQGSASLQSLQNEIDSALEKSDGSARPLFERLAKEIQAQSYFSSMERDIERIKRKLQ